MSRLIRYLDWKASEIDVAATFFCHPATYMDVKQREMQGTISPEFIRMMMALLLIMIR